MLLHRLVDDAELFAELLTTRQGVELLVGLAALDLGSGFHFGVLGLRLGVQRLHTFIIELAVQLDLGGLGIEHIGLRLESAVLLLVIAQRVLVIVGEVGKQAHGLPVRAVHGDKIGATVLLLESGAIPLHQRLERLLRRRGSGLQSGQSLRMLLGTLLQRRQLSLQRGFQRGHVCLSKAFALQSRVGHWVTPGGDVFERGLPLLRRKRGIGSDGRLLTAQHALTHAGQGRGVGTWSRCTTGLRRGFDAHAGTARGRGECRQSVLLLLEVFLQRFLRLAERELRRLLLTHLRIEGVRLGLPLFELTLRLLDGLLHACLTFRCQIGVVFDLVLGLLDEVGPLFGLRSGVPVLQLQFLRVQVDGIRIRVIDAALRGEFGFTLFTQAFVCCVHLGGFELGGLFRIQRLPFLVRMTRHDVPFGVLHPGALLLEILRAQGVVFRGLLLLGRPLVITDLALDHAVGIRVHGALLAAILLLTAIVQLTLRGLGSGFLLRLLGFGLFLSGFGSGFFLGDPLFLLLLQPGHLLLVGIGTLG